MLDPAADLTFFEFPYARPGCAGAGMVHRIVWRVASTAALDFWAARLSAEGYETESGEASLSFADFEGLGHELVVDRSGDEPLIADHPEIPGELALHGFEGVRAYDGERDATVGLLEELMGAISHAGERWEIRDAHRGGWIALDEPPAQPGIQSAGTVHHVAWGMGDGDEQNWLIRLNRASVSNSGTIDRHYFRSLYFRETGGILFELATEVPGFTVDGPVEDLGKRIIVPPWLESRREQVERRLTLPDPRADWPAVNR